MAYYVAELNISTLAMAKCTYPQTDGEAESAWEAGSELLHKPVWRYGSKGRVVKKTKRD